MGIHTSADLEMLIKLFHGTDCVTFDQSKFEQTFGDEESKGDKIIVRLKKLTFSKC